MINVTKSYLPPFNEYVKYLQQIWNSGWLTNNGPLVLELESRLQHYLEVPFLQYISNGTIALQIALNALDITKEVITTPFSYVATTTSILWENCKPVFVDIEDRSFCIDADKIEESITENTEAILATHVYGYPCDVEKIQAIANKYNLKVIYDAAHAFAVKVNGISILNYGDLSTLSFHATKLFHTVEGGAIICKTAELSEKLWLLKSFGHKYDDYYTVGINGKNSEFHAAMGLCNLPKVDELISKRRNISKLYDELLFDAKLQLPIKKPGLEYNYAYYPVVFDSEIDLLVVKNALEENGINTRRYFYPSLNQLPYLKGEKCSISEDISRRVLCLPLFYDLENIDVVRISNIILQVLGKIMIPLSI